MHQKKIAKLATFCREKYHSIPILRRQKGLRKNLRYVSYSIPTLCGLALLLIVGAAVNPVKMVERTFATEGEAAEDIALDDENKEGEIGADEDELVQAIQVQDENNGEENPENDGEYGVMTMAAIETPTLTLTIDGKDSVNLAKTVAPGEIGYLASTVTYTATNVADYRLLATYARGNTGLTNGAVLQAVYGRERTLARDENFGNCVVLCASCELISPALASCA